MQYLRKFEGDALPAPLGEIARNRVAAPLVERMESMGLTVEVIPGLAPLYEINRLDPERRIIWHQYDLALHPHLDPKDSVTVVIRERRAPIACLAGILAWVETNLTDELQSLLHFYEDPERMAEPGDQCIVTATTASAIRHCPVAWSVALWGATRQLRPGNPITTAAIRLAHLWMLAHWRFSHLLALSRDAVARRYAIEIAGFATCEIGVWIPSPDRTVKERERWLLTAPRDFLRWNLLREEAADVEFPLGHPSVAKRAQRMNSDVVTAA
ncbi:MAG TPA: hypothetical protein VLX09_01105 [Stellaceae bacterium]|nr:hypothetical protein [Stellaceae bacterium]